VSYTGPASEGRELVRVRWDDGTVSRALNVNLESANSSGGN
jgi:hypothetical protein